jgi:hypothetical protein
MAICGIDTARCLGFSQAASAASGGVNSNSQQTGSTGQNGWRWTASGPNPSLAPFPCLTGKVQGIVQNSDLFVVGTARIPSRLQAVTAKFPAPGSRDHPTAPASVVNRPASAFSVGLELFLQPGLLEDRIGGVPGLDAAIDREVLIARRAVPDFMVALTLAVKSAPVFLQYLLEIAGEVCHVSGRVQG